MEAKSQETKTKGVPKIMEMRGLMVQGKVKVRSNKKSLKIRELKGIMNF